MGKIIKDMVEAGLHRLRTDWLTARIVDFMFLESHGANWWLTTVTSDGKFLHAGSTPDYAPDEARQDYAHKVCRYMNKKAHYDGAWLVGWVDDANAFMCVWKDSDGDIQIMIDCIRPWSVVSKWPMGTWAGKAHKSYEYWYDKEQAIDASPEQQVKIAQNFRN